MILAIFDDESYTLEMFKMTQNAREMIALDAFAGISRIGAKVRYDKPIERRNMCEAFEQLMMSARMAKLIEEENAGQ